MTICRPQKLNRRMRHLNKMIKNARNEAKAYRDEATYHQAIIDSISDTFHINFKTESEEQTK